MNKLLMKSKYQIFNRMSLFSEDLNRCVFVDGDRAGGDEELLDSALVFEDGHDTRPQHGQGRNVVWQDTKGAGE
jgi:hypothetical protein